MKPVLVLWQFLRGHWLGLTFRTQPPLVFASYANVLGVLAWIVGFIFGPPWLPWVGTFFIWSATWYTLGRFHGWRFAQRSRQLEDIQAFTEMVPHVLADEDLEMPEGAREAMQEMYRAAQETLGHHVKGSPTGDDQSP